MADAVNEEVRIKNLNARTKLKNLIDGTFFVVDGVSGNCTDNNGDPIIANDSTVKMSAEVLLNIVNDITAPFDPDVPCVAGKTYYDENGKLYECVTAHSGAWNPDHFEETSAENVFAKAKDVAALQEKTLDLQGQTDDIKIIYLGGIKIVYPVNCYNPEDKGNGILGVDGVVTTDADHCYTGFIACEQGDVIRLYKLATPTSGYMTKVTAYDNHKNIMTSSGRNTNVLDPYTVPQGVSYVRITFSTSIEEYLMITVNTEPSEYSAYTTPTAEYVEDFLTPVSKQKLEETKKNLDAVVAYNGLLSLTDKLKLTLSFTDGKSITPSSGLTSNDADSSYSDYVPTMGFKRLKLKTVVYTATKQKGIAFYNSSKTYISGVIFNVDQTAAAPYSIVRNVPIPAGAAYFRTTWLASSNDLYNTFECYLQTEFVLDEIPYCFSKNVFDRAKATSNKVIRADGIVRSSTGYLVTDLIAVNPGDVLVGGSSLTSYALKYVCAYDEYFEVLVDSGAADAATYTVPDGVAYVRVSINMTYTNSTFYKLFRNGVLGKFEPFESSETKKVVAINYSKADNVEKYPLSALPSYILKNLAYKPLGKLSKGYVCLVADDGGDGLEDYTIPTIIDKGVPATWAVMQDSVIFQTQSGIDALLDSVTNHGCEIAQHGNLVWTTQYDEFTLNKFFDSEAEFFATLGLTPYGAVCPTHAINDLVRAVAGGRFGCLRTGFGNAAPYYDFYMNGPRSNLFGLSSYSCFDGTLDAQKAHLDYAKENNLLCFIFWHDNRFAEGTEGNLDARARFEGVIDYAKSIDIEFITMKDIPNLI